MDKAAIVGIGASQFSPNAPETELHLALHAITEALADAGLPAAAIDGMATYTLDNNTEIELARNLGVSLRFFSRIDYGGGGACAVVQQAAMAVATGVADVVICYRSLKERSWYRFGGDKVAMERTSGSPTAEAVRMGQYPPYGFVTPSSWAAMLVQRFMHELGVTSEDFGRVSVAARAYAATNPKAHFYQRPITLADHQASAYIAEPLRLLDCCMESDGAVALVITSTERAQDLPGHPVLIRGAAQGAGPDQEQLTSYYRQSVADLPETQIVAQELWNSTGLTPSDMRAAMLYDHFSPFVLFQLEALGFCGRGEAKDFVSDGHIGFNGSLPVNTHGGQLGEAFLHGLNGVTEAVRQVRGTAVNQVPKCDHVLVTAGTGVPTSGLILAAR